MKRLTLEPVESTISTDLEGRTKRALETLATLGREDFECSYLEHEIVYHRRLLLLLDESLIPGAQDPQIRDLLLRVRSTAKAHLKRTQVLAAAAGGSSSGADGRVAEPSAEERSALLVGLSVSSTF